MLIATTIAVFGYATVRYRAAHQEVARGRFTTQWLARSTMGLPGGATT